MTRPKLSSLVTAGAAATSLLTHSRMTYPMQPELSRQTHSARYIWFARKDQGRNRFALFRKKFQIVGVLWIT